MGLTDEQKLVVACDSSFQVTACAGGGKGFVKGTRVLTPSGYVMIESISEGDMIIGKSGKSVKVVGVYPRGLQTCYRVSFSNGYSVICDEDHLWAYQLPRDRWNGGSVRVHDIKYIYENVPVYVKSGSYSRKNIYLPMVCPVDFGGGVSDFVIHPYVLGCLLGDGSLSGRHAVGFANQESDIIDRFCGLLPESCSMSDMGNFNYRIKGSDGVNLVYRELERLGLSGKRSYEKFIPEEYLFSSVDSRVLLLQGLIDTDGRVAGSSYEFATASEQLANDVMFLCDTLGLSVTFSVRDDVRYEYKGDLRHGRVSYRLRIKPSSSIPVLHSSLKHSSRWCVPQSYARVCITGIELLDEKFETICLKVDSDDELFVIDRGIVTHNTTTILEWVKQHPEFKTLYLAFNRSVKQEMESKSVGVSNLTVMTAHGLAYQNVVKGSNYKVRSSFTVMDVIDLLDLTEFYGLSASLAEGERITDLEFATFVLNVFNSLCYSRCFSINDEDFRRGIRDEYTKKFGIGVFDNYSDLMYRCVLSIWKQMKSGSVPVTHDFYLKLYQVSKPVLRFDAILLDEAQDSNDVMLDIIERQDCIKGFVGDACQQIYGFRDAVNAFEKIEHKSFHLSNSFRFGEKIANLANKVLSWRDRLGATDTVNVTGLGVYDDDSIHSECFIARKNINLLAKAFELINEDYEVNLYFEGGYNGYTFSSNGSIWDVYNLYIGQHSKIKGRFLAKFKDWDAFKEFLEKGLDNDLAVLSGIVERYGRRLPDLLHRLKSRLVEDRSEADFILSTVHKAKGLEYDFVHVYNDFINIDTVLRHEMGMVRLDRDDEGVRDIEGAGLNMGDIDSGDLSEVSCNSVLVPLDDMSAVIEEINMLYVAITRARKRLYLDEDYYFTVGGIGG